MCLEKRRPGNEAKGGFTIHANVLLCGGLSRDFTLHVPRIDSSSIPARPCRVNDCVYCKPALGGRAR